MLLISTVVSSGTSTMSFVSSCMSPCRSDYIFTDEDVGVWHVVSEDSDHFRAWFAVIHRLVISTISSNPLESRCAFVIHQSHDISRTFRNQVALKFSKG